MGQNAPRINALVDLLNTYQQPRLEELRQKYPGQHDLLNPGIALGETHSKALHQVYVEVALEGLRTAKSRVEPNIRRLLQRLQSAKRLRLVGQVVAAVTSVGVIGAILGKWDSTVAVTTAVVNFGAVLCALVAGHLETPLHGGKGSLIDSFETLASTTAEAEEVIQELVLLGRGGADESRVMEQVRRANAIAGKLRIAERMLWGVPQS